MKDILVVSFQSLTPTDAGGTGKIGFYLAKQLHADNRLHNFIVSSKGKFTTTFPSKNVSVLSRGYLRFLNISERKLKLPLYVSRYIQEMLFDYFCSFQLDKRVKLLVSTTPFLPRTLKRAKEKNIKTILIPGNSEEGYMRDKVLNEAEELGLTINDAYTYAPRFELYERSVPYIDTVLAHSSVIYSTYKACFPEKNIVECYGLLYKRNEKIFRSRVEKQSQKIVFGYLAYSVLLKGLHTLLDVWNNLGDINAELLIGGPVDDSIKDIIDQKLSENQYKNVRSLGHVGNRDVFYDKIDWFVCPSIIDGGPVTVIEAIERNIPAIVSSGCGIKDWINTGVNGFVVTDKKDMHKILTDILTGKRKIEGTMDVSASLKIDIEILTAALKNEIYDQKSN
ncbi:MAG: glycosyl transferase group 1 [Mucilaginibacter sp.]|nr:glycosyl transferase group 1 [Mucilaginibacter sp.]